VDTVLGDQVVEGLRMVNQCPLVEKEDIALPVWVYCIGHNQIGYFLRDNWKWMDGNRVFITQGKSTKTSKTRSFLPWRNVRIKASNRQAVTAAGTGVWRPWMLKKILG